MKPLILDYTTERVGEYSPIYEYDYQLSLNVIKTKIGIVPFMDVDKSTLCLITKTRVNGEVDDYNISLLELETKTKVKQEADDNNLYDFLELRTKTLVKQESDD